MATDPIEGTGPPVVKNGYLSSEFVIALIPKLLGFLALVHVIPTGDVENLTAMAIKGIVALGIVVSTGVGAAAYVRNRTKLKQQAMAGGKGVIPFIMVLVLALGLPGPSDAQVQIGFVNLGHRRQQQPQQPPPVDNTPLIQQILANQAMIMAQLNKQQGPQIIQLGPPPVNPPLYTPAPPGPPVYTPPPPAAPLYTPPPPGAPIYSPAPPGPPLIQIAPPGQPLIQIHAQPPAAPFYTPAAPLPLSPVMPPAAAAPPAAGPQVYSYYTPFNRPLVPVTRRTP